MTDEVIGREEEMRLQLLIEKRIVNEGHVRPYKPNEFIDTMQTTSLGAFGSAIDTKRLEKSVHQSIN